MPDDLSDAAPLLPAQTKGAKQAGVAR